MTANMLKTRVVYSPPLTALEAGTDNTECWHCLQIVVKLEFLSFKLPISFRCMRLCCNFFDENKSFISLISWLFHYLFYVSNNAKRMEDIISCLFIFLRQHKISSISSPITIFQHSDEVYI